MRRGPTCRLAPCLAGISAVLAACATTGAPSNSPAASGAPSSPVAVSVVPSESASIVGLWRGEHTCEGIAEALGDAGFDEAVIIEAVVGNGLIPGVTSPDDVSSVTEACEEATVLEHEHEFTTEGQFYSYDQHGEQVDRGTYELVDDDTLTIGAPDREDVTFDFLIEGDHLTLEPQLPPGCTEFECQWAVMVAMPWSDMERVDEE
jgi:hypothetical protein